MRLHRPAHNYIRCKDEYDLLKKFIEFIASDYPHIITGWNIEFFDIPYLCNRTRKVLGEDMMKKFSPWNVVNQEFESESPPTTNIVPL